MFLTFNFAPAVVSVWVALSDLDSARTRLLEGALAGSRPADATSEASARCTIGPSC